MRATADRHNWRRRSRRNLDELAGVTASISDLPVVFLAAAAIDAGAAENVACAEARNILARHGAEAPALPSALVMIREIREWAEQHLSTPAE